MISDSEALEQTKCWIENIVIKHNFCPFAKKPFNQNTIRYSVSHAQDEYQLVDELVDELIYLENANPEKIETSVLIVPNILKDFDQYNQFIDIIDQMLEEMNLVDIIQVATFHPDYCFADLTPDDVRNYTNRSIFPMFHLIREDSVEHARATYPDVDLIPEKNMSLLVDIGKAEIETQVAQCAKPTSKH